jgi:hypothetical protein
MSPRNESPAASRFPLWTALPSSEYYQLVSLPPGPSLPWRLVGRLAPEPDGSPLFPSSPSVACRRYEPRKRPGPLAMPRCRDVAFPVEGSGRPLRSRSILLRCPAGRGYHSVRLRSSLQPFCLRFAVAVTRHHARLDTRLPGSGFAAIPGD